MKALSLVETKEYQEDKLVSCPEHLASYPPESVTRESLGIAFTAAFLAL